MYISKLNILGYKNAKVNSEIELSKGLNILVGENGAGKTTIIDALRLALKENEFSYMNINEDDFYVALNRSYTAPKISIDLTFDALNHDEQITFLTWCNEEFKAQLHLEVNSVPNRKGYYKKEIWGGISKASIFEEETYEYIDCIYLPPLRDAEEKLINGRKSRLAQLLKKQYGDNKQTLVEKVSAFNDQITTNECGNYDEMESARNSINKKLEEALGNRLGQTINLQFAETNFNRIVENIKMVFFPGIKQTNQELFRDISVNSLGYNNLLYIATVFAELELLKSTNMLTVLLIEEPEAHLHPQLQIKFIKYLEILANELNNIQVIVTTHSPVLAASVDLDHLTHITYLQDKIVASSLKNIDLGKSKNYLNRWLDITKSTLLFSKGVILVEGISEAMLIPTLAKIVLAEYNSKNSGDKLPSSLEEAGVSVININGINFKHFMKLFANSDGRTRNQKLPIFCAGITDNDPAKKRVEVYDDNGELVIKDGKPMIKLEEFYPIKPGLGANSALSLKKDINKSTWARLYSSPLKTFEYDLLMEGNIIIMTEVLKYSWPTDEGSVFQTCEKIIGRHNNNIDRASIADDVVYTFTHIDNEKVGKGMYAQSLTSHLEKEINEINILGLKENEKLHRMQEILKVPTYIKKAVMWACKGDDGLK